MAASLPILTFHSLDERPSVISFPPGLFERGMRRLHDSGYRTLNLAALIEYLQRGVPFPERSLAITFDDGYQSVYQHAFPILQRYGFSATIFLAVGENGNQTPLERLPSMCERSMLSWREIEEMHKCGITFGAHTLTHPDLTRLPLAELNSQVYESKAVIEDTLGSEVTCFAYPYGRYDKRCRDVVSRHFVCACSDKLALVHRGSDVLAIERIDVWYLRSERLFNLISARSFPWYVRARNIPRRIRRSIQFS